jgi:hypothetical protein
MIRQRRWILLADLEKMMSTTGNWVRPDWRTGNKTATSRAGRTGNSRPWTSQAANNGFGSFGMVHSNDHQQASRGQLLQEQHRRVDDNS